MNSRLIDGSNMKCWPQRARHGRLIGAGRAMRYQLGRNDDGPARDGSGHDA